MELTLSGSLHVELEQRLSSSPMLPDTLFSRIGHMDLGATAFTLVDAVGRFVAFVSYELTVVQVVGRPGRGPGELVRPRAARLDGKRLLVMDRSSHLIAAYGWGPAESGSTSSWSFSEGVADLRLAPDASANTDFAVLADGQLVVPAMRGPTYLTTLAPSDGTTGAGPLHPPEGPLYPDEESEKQLLRMFDRVTALGDGTLAVWDDDESTLIVSGDGAVRRWRLPEAYRQPNQAPSQFSSPDGRAVAISLGQPTIVGWTAHQGSVCMVLRPVPGGPRSLLALFWDGDMGSTPVLRRIELDLPGEPVSCGLRDEQLLVATETEALMFRFCDSAICEGG